MSEWSKNPPTEPGWYWWRRYPDGEQSPARILQRGNAYWHGVINDDYIIRNGEGEWWPERIEPPKE